MGGHHSGASWHRAAKPDAIKGWGGKWGRGAGKVNVLTWGDLPPRRENGNPDREVRLRRQGSAEAIVPPRQAGRAERREGLKLEQFAG